MPVSFSPAAHGAKPISPAQSLSAANLLASSTSFEAKEILQSSLGRGPSAQFNRPLLPASKGLVSTITDAYNQHHALVLRPDDVWLAILTQFSFFVNGPGRAEELRSRFVAHEGKKKLVVEAFGTRYTVDFGQMAHQMTGEMEKHIVDAELRDWILPKFSTTTPNDTIVASVLMMATLKAYFEYTFMLTCGIPRVTLLGEKADWENLVHRAKKLNTYGAECTAWHEMLAPVLERFALAFDAPGAAENVDFWQRVAHYHGGGSGPRYLSGWVTAFAVFDQDGKWLGPRIQETPKRELEGRSIRQMGNTLALDGVSYHQLDTSKLPGGHAEVDVKLDDNGQLFDTTMVAGIVASQVANSGDQALSEGGKNDTVAPMPGWWIFVKRSEEGRRAEEQARLDAMLADTRKMMADLKAKRSGAA